MVHRINSRRNPGNILLRRTKVQSLSRDKYPRKQIPMFAVPLVHRCQERERWTKAIVRDELARPAEISEMFLKDWEQQEEKDRQRQLKVRLFNYPFRGVDATCIHPSAAFKNMEVDSTLRARASQMYSAAKSAPATEYFFPANSIV